MIEALGIQSFKGFRMLGLLEMKCKPAAPQQFGQQVGRLVVPSVQVCGRHKE